MRGGEAHAYFFAGTLPCDTTAEPTGSISVTKRVGGEAADIVPGSTSYTVSYQVAGGDAGTLELLAGEEQTLALAPLPVDTEVTLTEQDLPPVDDVAWEPVEWRVDGEPVTGASATVEVGTDVEVVLVNTATDVVRGQSSSDVATGGQLPVTGPRVAALVLLALALVGSGVLVVLFRRQSR
ncbi:DUF5979 domain-containing protein [Isoptericola halotolerans]|uniref:DUF5979 domain-containing protein n=1 Tax=Isoptericola halotolerans TaxID=300560 RepID=UPI003890085F